MEVIQLTQTSGKPIYFQLSHLACWFEVPEGGSNIFISATYYAANYITVKETAAQILAKLGVKVTL